MKEIIINKYYIKDIRNWEEENRYSLFELFNKFDYTKLIILVRLGNNNCSEEKACDIIDRYMEVDGNNIETAIKEIRDNILGEDKKDTAQDTDSENNKSYANMSDMLSDMFVKLTDINISYGDFWSMTTRELNNSFKCVQEKAINSLNTQLLTNYQLANLIMAGLAGKMPTEAPRINLNKVDDEYKNLDNNAKESIKVMRGLIGKFKKGGIENG